MLPALHLARPEDSLQLVALLHLWHAEQAEGAFDDTKAAEVINRLIQRREGICIVAKAANNRTVAGSMALHLSQFWFARQPHLEILWHFVHPDHRRKTTHAKDLIEIAKQYAVEIGIPLRHHEVNTQEMASKVKLYERQFKSFVPTAVFMFNSSGEAA